MRNYEDRSPRRIAEHDQHDECEREHGRERGRERSREPDLRRRDHDRALHWHEPSWQDEPSRRHKQPRARASV
eukprot:3686049-Prymnesium_polylepis.1